MIPLVPRPTNWIQMAFLDKLKHYALHLTPEHAKYADKLHVKKLIGNLGIKNLHFAKVIKVFKDNEKLVLSELPRDCVIKSNNGWNDMIIIKNGRIEKMITKGKKRAGERAESALPRSKKRRSIFRSCRYLLATATQDESKATES